MPSFNLPFVKQIFPATTAEMAMEIALAKKLEEASKSATIMKRVSPTEAELQKKVRDLEAKGAIALSGEPVKPKFVQPNPKISQNPAGYSREQWEKNQQYKHTINQLHQFSEPEIVKPESIEGHPVIINPGDRTAGGIEIVDVNGVPLSSPSKQEAGASFGHEMEDNATDEWWASGEHAAEGVQEKARHAYEETGVLPLAIYTAMGAETGNFSMHNTDVALKMLYHKNPSLTQMHTFNKIMETGYKKGVNKETGEEIWVRFPDFAGLENPEELRRQLQKNPTLRKFFINRLETEKTVSNPLDLPSGMAIRHAITENDLRDVPNGSTGYAIGALHPESDIQTNINHNTYNRSINGNFLGRMQLQLPWEEYFPENYKAIMEHKGQSKSPFGTIQKLKTYETFTPELVDKLMRMNEIYQNKKFAKGGNVTIGEQEPETPSLDDMNYALNKKAGGGLIEKLVSGLVKPQTFKAVKAGDTVSGLLVRPDIPNKSSIGASLYEYSTHGVQEVPMSAFTVKGKPKYRNKEQENYTKDLAQQIKENKELNPLIVIKDKEGHYVLEGAHRFDALRELGIESFPALMVHDLESLPNEEINPDATKKNGGVVKMAGGGNVESDSSLPLQAHLRRFTTPDYLDAQDIGVTGRYGDNAITLGRQIMSKNELDENPNMRYRQSMDYGQYSTPFHEGQLNARVMKDPQRPDLQAMLQYLQSVGKGTAGIGVMGNRTSEGDRLRALSLMYGLPIDENSSINGMASIPFGGSPSINVQYNRRFAEGGDVKKMHPALEKLVEEYVTNKQPNPARQTINEQLGRETLKQPFPEHRNALNQKSTVGLGAGLNLEGNKAMPSSQMELFKRKGGAVSIDEMKYALTRKR